MRKADNLPPSCAVVTKSGSLNFLEPSGPVQACNETALPLSIAQTVYTVCIRMNYKIVPVHNFNIYLHCGISGNE